MHQATEPYQMDWHPPVQASNLTVMTTYDPTRESSPQAQVMAQIADEDKPMPSDEDVERIAREHQLPETEAKALLRFARAVSKMAEE